MISAGHHHSLLVDHDGKVWSTGLNNYGQLGLGHCQPQNKFGAITEGPEYANQISAADCGHHSSILDHQGGLWMFGKNNYSKTGFVAKPTLILGLPRIKMVSCGMKHTIVLDYRGYIWGTGDNAYSQLSVKEKSIRNFIKLETEGIGRVVSIRCGARHSIIQNEALELWGTGYNGYGQLGVGELSVISSFQRIPLDTEIKVQSFDCAGYHTILLDNDGQVWSAGSGRSGNLGLGHTEHRTIFTKISNIDPMKNVVCGGHSTMMIDGNGSLHVCGWNTGGQLGTGHCNDVLSPFMIPDLPNISKACVSYFHSILVDVEGGLWASGYNFYGALGTGNSLSTNRFVPVEGIKGNNTNEKRFDITKRAQ